MRRSHSLVPLSLLVALGAACGGPDDHDDDGASDAGDADDADDASDDNDGDGDGLEPGDARGDLASFAAASPECPPAGSALTIDLTRASRPRTPPIERSRMAFVRGALSGTRRAARPPAGATALEAGQFYLRRYIPAGLAAPAEIAAVHDRGGAIVVKVRQRVEDVPVFGAELNFVMAADRSLVAVSGELAAGAAADDGAAAEEDGAAFEGAARSAIAAAARDRGVSVDAAALVRAADRPPFAEFRLPAGQAIAVARARRVYFDDGASLLPAFHVELVGRFPGGPGPEVKSAVVDERGQVRFRNDKTHYAEPFAYRVYADAGSLEPGISPFCDQGIPHPTGQPDGFAPIEPCAPALVSLIHAGVPTADPWVADDATESRGNNADAFFHIQTGPDGEYYDFAFAPERDFHARTTGARAFDYLYDHARAPTDYFEDDTDLPPDPADPQLNAKIIQGFYAANYLHDLLYRHGYDEAAGNSQTDNYGRGGLGGDPLLVIAGSLGTFTYGAPEGVPPFVNMGRNGGSRLRRDATLDFSVFAHEWMHTMQHRLIGDSEGLSTAQGESLGEGWSDFLGLVVSVRPGQAALPINADWQGAFALGAYDNQQYCNDYPPPLGVLCTDVDDSYYFGIRRYPFTVDKSKSPLTFRYIANGVPLPEGIPTRYWQFRIENAEIHSAGEIWASALWGCYRALLVDGRYSFEEARGRLLDYLVAGMKATPFQPTFLEARDAFLAVAKATDDADYQSFRQAFAERGMGAGALAPPRESHDFKGVIESMRAEGPALTFVSASLDDRGDGDADGILDRGETGVLTVRLRNTGFDDLGETTVHVAPVDESSEVSQSDAPIASAPGEDIVLELPVALREVGHRQLARFEVTFADAAAGLEPTDVEIGFRVHYDVAHTERGDAADDPITQGDWFMENGTPYQEAVWDRTESGEGHAYRAAGARMAAYVGLISPCVLASETGGMTLRFSQNLSVTGFGQIEVRTAGSDWFDWRPFYWYDGTTAEPEVTVDFGQEYAGQWLQIRLLGIVPAASDGDVPAWTIDDIELSGIDNLPFAGVYEQGSAPMSQ